ncbi:MAG TPA: DUF4129 domain-containing protein [Gemmatimonadaceae bacterium]|nr:DUF4129 domain-containing protein [Gemmatimonadaceae bacterium]
MWTQAADSLSRWPAGAIHDTVSAIVQQSIYQRRLGRSLAERFWAWFWEQLGSLFNAVAGTPAARAVTLTVAALIVAAVIVRIGFAARNERRAPRAVGAGGFRAQKHLPTLEEARRLAREGRYADGIHVLYAAILDTLAQRRLVRLHPSKTSGDFARELYLRGHPAHDAFKSFVRRFDRLFYGHDPCDAAAFDALWGQAERVLSVAQTPAR